MQRKTVCHIIHKLDFGGLENGLVNLINRLPVEEFQHSIISLKPASDFKERIRVGDVRIYDARKLDGIDVGVYGRVWRLLRRIRPQIVHTRNLPALDLLVPAFLSGRPRLIHSEHGLSLHEVDGKNMKYNRLRWASRLITDHYIAVCKDLEHWLGTEIGIPQDRISVIYNGVDTNKFSPDRVPSKDLPATFAAPETFIIGTVGRLDPIKNQVDLVKAFCSLLSKDVRLRRSLRLLIVGEGPAREECESILAEHGAAELAWLPGSRDDVANLMRNMDLFVLPSLREGISNTALEAMSSGLPVVASNVGGTPEIVVDEMIGRLVPVRAPEALGRAILDYYDNRALLAEHANQARRHVTARFSLDAMVAGYRRVYQSV